jgi:hypothetical protein
MKYCDIMLIEETILSFMVHFLKEAIGIFVGPEELFPQED